MKNVVLMIVIAATTAIAVPRNLQDVGDAFLHAGAAFIRVGLALYRHGYDAGKKEHDEFVPDDDAPPVITTEYFPHTAKPNRPECFYTHCEPLFDGRRHGKRCYWRCPRERPPKWHFTEPDPPLDFKDPDPPRAPPPRRRITPQYEASMPTVRQAPILDPNLFLVGLGIAGILGLAWLIDRLQTIANLRSAERATQVALYDAQEAADAQTKLSAAARHADEIIKRQAASAFRRGRHSS